MVKLGYRKLYADLVVDNGTVCIVYATWLNVAGLRQHSAGYELYTPDGSRRVVHATGPAHVDSDGANGPAVRFPTAAGQFSFSCRRSAGEPSSPHHMPTSDIIWRLLVGHGEAEAHGVIGLESPLRGVGYSDWVELARAPCALKMRRIQWGRAHIGEETLVWNRLTLLAGQMWQSVFDGRRWSSNLELAHGADGLASVQTAHTAIALGPSRLLHQGAALDADRVPGRLARAFARVLAGRMEESRRLSTAQRAGSGESGTALHEDVWLGRP